MSDKKFGEKDSVAYCQPTIIQISPNLGHLKNGVSTQVGSGQF